MQEVLNYLLFFGSYHSHLLVNRSSISAYMGQKHSKQLQSKKITKYLSSLCTGITHDPEISQPKKQPHLHQAQQYLKKMHRITLHLDHALVKFTRKNLAPQEFPTQSSISIQIEKHIMTRIAPCEVVLLEGIFTEHFVQAVPYAIKALRSNRTNFAPMSQGLLTGRTGFSLRKGCVDCMVVSQTSNGVGLLDSVLGGYGRLIDRFVLVVEQQLQRNDYHRVFIKYGQSFMFQVQKVMLVNKCIANIIYVSSSLQFLKIDSEALAFFLVDKMETLDSLLDKSCLVHLINGFLSANLELKVINAISQLILSPQTRIQYDQQFINRMERCPGTEKMIIQYWEGCKSNTRTVTESSLPKFYHNTPQFCLQLEKNESQVSFETSIRQQKRLVDISFGRRISQQLNDVI